MIYTVLDKMKSINRAFYVKHEHDEVIYMETT